MIRCRDKQVRIKVREDRLEMEGGAVIRCRDKQVRIKVREDRLKMDGGCDKM